MDVGKLVKALNNKESKGVSLRLLLVAPFVMHILVAVIIVGYLSLRNCQDTVDQLANQLTDKVSNAIDNHLDSYIEIPQQINQLNTDAIASGSLNINNAEHRLLKQIQIFNASKISYKLKTGEFIEVNRLPAGRFAIKTVDLKNKNKLYTYTTDSQGNNRQLIRIDNYKPNLEADISKTTKPNWSQVLGNSNIAISANSPIYDRDRQIIGVTSSELALENLNKYLRNLEISRTGQVFIIERDGSLVASSSNEKLLTSNNRINALDSKNHAIQATATYINQKFGNFRAIKDSQKVEFAGEHDMQVVRVQPWRDNYGLDWLIVVVVPENDFMAQVHANAQVIVVLSLVALITSTSLGLTISRWIVRPIHRLSAASSAIASGDLNQNVEFKSVNELGVLSQSFNQMALQLKESFEQLETRVEERTIELNQSKQLAEAANHAKSEFLANMSHELRTPLNAILGFAQIMNRDSSIAPHQQENLGIINRSGEHLLSLINDVLDMSKIEAGRITLTENAFDLYDLLNTIYEMFKLKAAAKGLQLGIECDPNLPQYIYTDESKLRQILLNLLGNAIKFTDAGKVNLHVEGKQKSDRYTLTFAVEDTGYGIAPHELASLFEPFVQTETGRNSGQGTGLGLPISRKFVQLMGGDITVSSTLGKGTIFHFDIQVETVPAIESKSAHQQVIGLEPRQTKYRILVVDDRYENRRLLTKLLTPIGFEVCEAENGQEAIAMWQSWEPHLIWMDMRMPVMNGYEATKYIKSHLQGQATAIVALTASILEEEKAIVLASGCDDFVRKPFREEVIWEKMAQYLGVRYIYAQKEELVSTHVPDLLLEPSCLEVMSVEWIEKLHYAAIELDAEQMLELIAQIPEKYNSLATALQQKVNDFDFDRILNLTACIPSL